MFKKKTCWLSFHLSTFNYTTGNSNSSKLLISPESRLPHNFMKQSSSSATSHFVSHEPMTGSSGYFDLPTKALSTCQATQGTLRKALMPGSADEDGHTLQSTARLFYTNYEDQISVFFGESISQELDMLVSYAVSNFIESNPKPHFI